MPTTPCGRRRNGARRTRRFRDRRRCPDRAQPSPLRPSPSASGRARPPPASTPGARHAHAEPVGVPPQSLPPPRQALPGRRTRPRAGERSATRRRPHTRPFPRGVRSVASCRSASASRVALAHRARTGRVRPAVPGLARRAAAESRDSPVRHRGTPPRQRLHDGSRRNCRRCHTPRLAARLCLGLAVRRGGQLGHAALGAPRVPRGGQARPRPSRHRLHRTGVQLVPRSPRSPGRTQALVRLRRVSGSACHQDGRFDAAGRRRGGHGRSRRARPAPHRQRQVTLLPGSRAVALLQDRSTDRGHLAPGRPDGRPGGRSPRAGDRLRRDDQRHALATRTGRRPRPRQARRCGDPAHVARAAPKPLGRQHAQAAGGRRMGGRRGPLPVELGSRLPAGLSLHRPLHPGARRRRADAAGHVPHGDSEAGRRRGHPALFPRTARHLA